MQFETKARIVIVAVIVVFAAMVGVAHAIPRPPALDPAKSPYELDLSQIGADLLGWKTAEPNELWTYDFGVWCREETPVRVTVTHGTVQAVSGGPDPTGGYNRGYRLTYVTPSTEQVEYIEIIAELLDYGTVDARCVTLRVYATPVPIIYAIGEVLSNPVIYAPTATPAMLGRDWQRLAKLVTGMTERQAEALLRTLRPAIPEYVAW